MCCEPCKVCPLIRGFSARVSFYKGTKFMLNLAIMAKATKKAAKPRASTYEPKVKFNGTFEQLVGISVKDAEKRTAAKKAAKKA
jgi:hypothetical protein